MLPASSQKGNFFLQLIGAHPQCLLDNLALPDRQESAQHQQDRHKSVVNDRTILFGEPDIIIHEVQDQDEHPPGHLVHLPLFLNNNGTTLRRMVFSNSLIICLSICSVMFDSHVDSNSEFSSSVSIIDDLLGA